MMQGDRIIRPSFPSRRLAPARPAGPLGAIRPIYAAIFDLNPTDYDAAADAVLRWLQSHPSLRGNESSVQGLDFDLNHSLRTGLVAQAAQSPDGSITVIRLQHRETLPDGKLDRLRDWRVEATIERTEGQAWIATRQWFAGLAGDVRECRPPRFISELWSAQALSDIEIFERTCRIAEYDLDADDVASLIGKPTRDLPVVVMADGCPMDHERMALDLVGLAHVVKLTRQARFRLRSVLREALNLEHGSLQTFYPRLGESDIVAPASRFETIIGWKFGSLVGPAAFSKWLRAEIGNALVTRLVNDPAHRSYEEVRTLVVKAQRTERPAPAIDAELLALAFDENIDLQKQIAELTERAQNYLNEKVAIDELYRQELRRNHQLQAAKIALQHALNEKTGATPTVWNTDAVERLIEDQPEPATIFDAVEQAELLFGLHNLRVRVSETAKESSMEALQFKRPADVQAALIRLGFLWPGIRASGKRLDHAATEGLRFPCAMFESDTTMRKFGYQRVARIGEEQAILQKHVKLGGGGKDEAARIYFGDRNDELLIGHVGRHLDVAKSQ